MAEPERIGIYFLREIWEYYQALKRNESIVKNVEWKYIQGAFNRLGIGIEPTIQYVMTQSLTFEDFERWIEENGTVSKDLIAHFNANMMAQLEEDSIPEELVINKEDMDHFNREGYVIIKHAVSREDAHEAVKTICNAINVDLSDRYSWYNQHPLKQGIMVQLFHSPILDKIRLSPRIKKAFQQLWNKQHLVVSVDRVSFNPPETKSYQFPGPDLHWDVSLKQPIPFGLQGLIYLTDTSEEQGAFTVIPGFHNTIDEWLNQVKEHPRDINLLEYFEEKPIAANAGDLIIWHHCLPHGSRPNHASSPRIVQYVNYLPLDLEYQEEWV